MSEEKRYQIAVSLISGVGDVIGKKLIAYCSSAEAVFSEGVKALNKIPGIGSKLSKIIKESDTLDRAGQELVFMEKQGVHIDSIVSTIAWSSSKVAQMLLLLEFKGVIIVLPGKMYKRVE